MDLISSKFYLNSSIIIIIIGLVGTYIERYLSGGAEFKTSINRITVRSLSFLHHHHHPRHHPRHHNSPATTRNHPTTSPSPLLRDVGSTIHTSGCAKRTTAAPAPPLSKGMWAGIYLLDRGIGEGKHKGGPKKWEARPVRRKNGLRHLP